MGLVTNVYWNCPGCKTRNEAQVYGEWEDPDEFPVGAVPGDRGLKWNPFCTHCNQYQLKEPETVAFRIVKVGTDDATRS